jgi:hypothetical protein
MKSEVLVVYIIKAMSKPRETNFTALIRAPLGPAVK